MTVTVSMTVDVAAIIVTWNVRELALQAVGSLLADLAHSGLIARVIVVDSASQDDTPAAVRAQFPSVEVIASPENRGFGAANNLGLRHLGLHGAGPGPASPAALPRAVYLLNPDTITQPGATRALFEALWSAPDVGLTGARLTYGDGRFQHGAFAFPGLRQLWAEFFPLPGRLIEGRFNGRYPPARYAAGQPFAVDFTLGATMMLRGAALAQVGGFDEGFFMYAEEVDLAWRLQRAGWRALCVPAAHVVHLGGQSTGQVRARSQIHLWQSRLRLFEKHYPPWKAALARRLVLLGLARRVRQAQQPGTSAADRAALHEIYQAVARMIHA
ncbi:MAG: glycosyltransferase family 2 protein [Anaerolineae bacterium]|nr:glycosyltransferase family 2 protein [Anaerolineae bacterium]